MKRIWMAWILLACVLFTGCNSVFMGDTTVILPEQTEEGTVVPSATTKYNDQSQVDKFKGSGDGAFFFREGRSTNQEDIISFECIDYQEATGVFVYAYQTMVDGDQPGDPRQMATEMLGYNPEKKEGFVFYSHTTDPSVEPTMFVQKMLMANDEYQYFIYFGGEGYFYLPDGRLYRQINLKDRYTAVVEEMGNIKTWTVLSVNALGKNPIQSIISVNILAERVTVDENTEWTDEMKESDHIAGENGEEGSVSLRIDYVLTNLGGKTLTYDLEKKTIVLDYLKAPMTYSAPEGYLLEVGMKLGEVVADTETFKPLILGGFIESVENIVEERVVEQEEQEDQVENDGTGETETEEIETEEVLVQQKALLTPGSYFCMDKAYYSGISLVGYDYEKGIRYNGNSYVAVSDNEMSLNYIDLVKKEVRLDSEIVTAGPGAGGELVVITKDKVYIQNNKRGNEALLKDLDISRDVVAVDTGETQAGEQSEETQEGEQSGETQAESQPEETQAGDQSEEKLVGNYGENLKKDNSQLMDAMDESVVDAGEAQNQDTVDAGMSKADGYDKEQLTNDGIVADGVTYNPDVEANPETFKPYNFMMVGNGLLVSTLNSGLVNYKSELNETVSLFNYPVYRFWQLSDGSLMVLGFDDNSKRYVLSDMPFAKAFRIRIRPDEKGKETAILEENHE